MARRGAFDLNGLKLHIYPTGCNKSQKKVMLMCFGYMHKSYAEFGELVQSRLSIGTHREFTTQIDRQARSSDCPAYFKFQVSSEISVPCTEISENARPAKFASNQKRFVEHLFEGWHNFLRGKQKKKKKKKSNKVFFCGKGSDDPFWFVKCCIMAGMC